MSIGVVGKVDGHREMFPLCDDSRSCLPIRRMVAINHVSSAK